MPLTPEEKNRIYEEEKERILAQEKIKAELEEEKERKLAREKIKAELEEEKEQELAQEKINAELKEEKAQKAGKKSNKGCMLSMLAFLVIVILVNSDSIVDQFTFYAGRIDSKTVRNARLTQPKQADEEKATDLKADQPNLIPYTVINRSEAGSFKVSYDLRVDIVDGGLPTTEELAVISRHLKSKESDHDRTFVLFYLPGMEVGAGAFATAHHNPTLEVTIAPFLLPEKYRELPIRRKEDREEDSQEKNENSSVVETQPPRTNSKPTRAIQIPVEWYIGGDLHDKNAIAWQDATYKNKLATCGDLVSTMWKKGMLRPAISSKISTVEDIKPLARNLLIGLDAAFKPADTERENRILFSNQTVAGTAAILGLQLGWLK